MYIHSVFVFVDLRHNMQFLITTTAVVILLVGVASLCPSECRCLSQDGEPVVDCSHTRLDSIPTDLPDKTIRL
jgi:ribosome biogenesis protein Tsr3